jgi:hypothetical protein
MRLYPPSGLDMPTARQVALTDPYALSPAIH